LGQLEHHVQHAIARQTALQTFGPMTAGGLIDDLPEDLLEEFYSYFESDPKYRDVAQMIR
jgi:hypothetical protein